MELTTKCLECLLQRNLETARSLGDEQTAMAFAREFLQNILQAPKGVSTPYFSPIAADLFCKYYGLDIDRFREEKELSNRFVLERLDRIRHTVETAEDPVYAGMQAAILGNYLDFAAMRHQVDFGELDRLLEKSRELPLDRRVYQQLCADLEAGERLLYLTDNAGEIGFDRVLAETIAKKYPHLKITFCVRGGPAVNDATREDAQIMGIPFPVIDNGSRISGTEIPFLGAEAADALEKASVVIAKGQGNTETMYGCGFNVYYLFLVKCERFTDEFHQPRLTPMLVRERG